MRMSSIMPKLPFGKGLILIAAAAILGGAVRPAAAEDWPTRPVTLVVSFAPGALWELGADVVSIGVEPDGVNINKY